MNDAVDRLIVALDVPTVSEARQLTTALGQSVTFYKVGLELIMRGGLGFVEELISNNKRVFLDMKLLDISNTVERATANAAEMGAEFLTIHGHDLKTMRAAVAGRGNTKLKLLAVTVLTHLSREDLKEHLVDIETGDLALHRATLAAEAGCDGVICSPLEAKRIKEKLGNKLIVVTPGIRLSGGGADDQARVTTPESAIQAGADYLVVGRPITQASNPKMAADHFVHKIREASPPT